MTATLPDPAALAVGPCRGCGRSMLPQAVARWHPQLLGGGYVRSNGHGMCVGCCSRAARCGTLPDPAPRRERVRRPAVRVAATYVVTCEQCGDLLTTTRSEDARRTKQRHAESHRVVAA